MNRNDIKIFLIEKMNLEQPKGLMKSFLKYKNEKEEIIKTTNYLNEKSPITERIYHIINNLYEVPKCIMCDNKVKFINLKNGYYKTCSAKCNAINPSTLKKRIENINIKNEEDPDRKNKIHQKKINTWIEKCGYDHPMKIDDTKNKIKKTNLKLYGVPNAMQNEEVKNKLKNTIIRKYDVDNISKNKEIREKIKNILLKRYNCIHQMHIKEVKEKVLNKQKKIFEIRLNKFLENNNLNILDYNDARGISKFKCLKCNTEFEQRWNNVQQGYLCPVCFPRNTGTSLTEKELKDFIKSLNIEIQENIRNIISPYELDIFIPGKNMAIEFNGLYWHSDLFTNKLYHKNKLEECKKNNIRLIQIFEDEWLFKKDIVKFRLKQILNIKSNERIHARKCEIKEIDTKLKNEFLENYHIQGKDNSVIKLGAFYNNELVSVMTFSHGNISKGSDSKNTIWELNRFCNNYNYHIPGIASKLLKYFENNFEWEEIFSYADLRWSEGNVYYKLGFNFNKTTIPNYWYFKGQKRIHRFNLRKRKDESKDKTEIQLRSEEGYYRIWDCGHLKFIKENTL